MMAPKTSQLQIRVSPAEKATLKRLAGAQGLTVSEFVLRKALPTDTTPLAAWRKRVEAGVALSKTLSDLALELTALDDDAIGEVTASMDATGLSDLHANAVAAAVERDASRRGMAPPAWTEGIRPLARPWFAWRLRSLRPHLLRIAPVQYKRRGVYLTLEDDPRR